MEDNKKFSFADMLEKSLDGKDSLEGKVVTGTIVGIKDDKAIIDVGLKAEGRLFLNDIKALKEKETISIGDTIDVFVERFEDRNGEPILSIEKAKKEAVWKDIENHLVSGEIIKGMITGRAKGGFSVDIKGTLAFLPGSQVDLRLIKDITPLQSSPQPFKVIKMDRVRNNIVVSRRAVLELSRNEAKAEILSKFEEGMILKGIVKNITDYGAFVDIGGIDGLLHVTDMSWKRVPHPSEVVKVGDNIDVQIIKFNKEAGRISLGMKQLMKTPWENIDKRFLVGEKYQGKVVNITDYGAFVELEEGIEGMIYISEFSWTRRSALPNKLVNVGDIVEVMVLEVNLQKKKISLGLKQCQENPWKQFAEQNPIGTKLKGEVKNITEFGIFVGVNDVLDGMIHMSDVSWQGMSPEKIEKEFEKGKIIEVIVLDVKPDKERINLGLKQLIKDPFVIVSSKFKKGDIVVTEIKEVQNSGVDVMLADNIPGFIKKADISADRTHQRTDELTPGEKVEAIVISLSRNGVVNLSIKALKIQRDEEALQKFGSTSSGASLGDILSVAIEKNDQAK